MITSLAIECKRSSCKARSTIISDGEIECCPVCGTSYITTNNGIAELVTKPKFRLLSKPELRGFGLRDDEQGEGASSEYVEQDGLFELVTRSPTPTSLI